ncbi:MAG: hypothetical protein IK086_07360 [Clostridia bacterium]|nr:hypothetical protein [Clostridia bacterium]
MNAVVKSRRIKAAPGGIGAERAGVNVAELKPFYWKPSNAYPEVMNYYCLTEVYQRALQKSIIKS